MPSIPVANFHPNAILPPQTIFSGRYGQPTDSQELLEMPCFIPRQYLRDPDFQFRAALPHHKELAVDREETTNALYPNVQDAEAQCQWRFAAACNHIRQAYCSHPETKNTPAWP